MRKWDAPTPRDVADAESARAAWQRWLTTAKRGESFVYWRGFLVCDRAGQREPGRWQVAEALGDVAWMAQRSGFVVLTQRRSGPSQWLYMATRL